MGISEERRPRFGLWLLAVKLGPKLLSILFKSKAFWAALSLGIYSSVFSWKFALILMGSVFFHELGHVRAMKVFGIEVKGIYFLPFMGGAAVGTGQVETRKAEAYIALWGPLWGFALALATLDVYALTGSEYAAAVAAWMATINLFNLLPVWPLDGGRLLASVGRSVGTRAGFAAMVFGYAALFVGAIVLKLGLFVFLIIAGGFELWGELRAARAEAARKAAVSALARMFLAEENPEAVIADLERRKALAWSGDVGAISTSDDSYENVISDRLANEPYGLARSLAVYLLLRMRILKVLAEFVPDTVTALLWANADLPDLRDEFHAWLRGSKQPEPMTATQGFAAMAGYGLLIAALAAILYAAQVNPVAGAALDIFRN